MATNFETLRELINHISVSSETIKSHLKEYQSVIHDIMSEDSELTFDEALSKLLRFDFSDHSVEYNYILMNQRISLFDT